MVFAIGPAGVGKTWLAASHAVDALLAGKTEKIILTRATVPVSGENLGFLPGDLAEKMDPWVAELYDVMQERIGLQRFQQLVGEKKIQVIPFAMMRGRSIRDSIVIVDEMQNATVAQAKMLVTRIGEGTQMLICGDLGQSDLRGRNGLVDLLDIIEAQDLKLPVVRFGIEDVRRSRLCEIWVKAYERKEKEAP